MRCASDGTTAINALERVEVAERESSKLRWRGARDID
jgi:hypothetical protein